MDASIIKLLNDKLYDKRKAGALDLEALIRQCLANSDHTRITKIVHQLCHDFAYAIHQPHARNGGLIGLAAAAIALGPEVAPHLEEIVPPVLACFTDQDARVRYYACESMYNIAKVAKGEILLYYNEVFDALCKLTADSELSVKNGSELLDRLVKDIVSESAASYVSVMHTRDGDKVDTGSVIEGKAQSLDSPTAFSLQRFVPLLQERILVINPFTRMFLVSWITLLDSIPDLELVTFLPSFLPGIVRFLSDPNPDVHTATQQALDRFLAEIKKIARVKRGIALSKRSAGDDGLKRSLSSEKSDDATLDSHGEGQDADDAAEDDEKENASIKSGSNLSGDEVEDLESATSWEPGQDTEVDHAKIIDIMATFLNESSEEEIQLTALRWLESFFEICPEEMLQFVPRLLTQVLPALSNDVDQVRTMAGRVNNSLMGYIMSLSNDGIAADDIVPQPVPLPGRTVAIKEGVERRESNMSARAVATQTSIDDRPVPQSEEQATSPAPDLDYEAAVGSLTLQFLNEHEATRVAALQWLIMLHRKSPRKIMAINDGTFPALLKTLSDPSENVVTRDLTLLSQISKGSDDSYFTSFMVNLLKLFCTDRKLLETRGNLIIRQLCVSLSPERIYKTLADCLEKEEDLEFASIMVQNLNNNLITAPELAELRKRVRNLETRDGQTFFVSLFRSWCHNGVATFSLCLLAQAYEQAYHLLLIFGEMETTVNTLIQIDKLVQLLESPVFTSLRLQLLEPEKNPFLYKCLYGILMLLPQSAAFAALKNRLNSVSAIGYLHIAPRTATAQASTTSTYNRLKAAREEGGIKWVELLDKFKAVQERARRAQRPLGTYRDEDDQLPLYATVGSTGRGGGTVTPEPTAASQPKQLQLRPGSAAAVRPGAGPGPTSGQQPVAAGQNGPTAAGGHQKTKGGLAHLGRFAGVAGRKAKK